MTSPDFLEREPESPAPAEPPSTRAAPSPLAVHGDPSHPDPGQGFAPAHATGTAQRGQVAWVAPAEMPALVGRKLLGRAVEVQSAFARRNWRAPVRLTRAVVGGLDRSPTLVADTGPTPSPSVTRVMDADDLLGGPDPEEVQLP